MKLALLQALNEERAARRAVIVVTALESGEQRLVKAKDATKDDLQEALGKRLRSGKSGTEETRLGKFFLTVFVPPPRLLVTGAVHISQELAPMAQRLGYDVIIVDPRTAFATPARFAGINLIADWPDKVLPTLGIDAHTAFAALTHDPKIDDPALLHALSKECFYIGALGSKKTHATRLERLKSQGATDAQLSRIHAPIGLAIGAVSPAEISISILAEITARLRLGQEERGTGSAR